MIVWWRAALVVVAGGGALVPLPPALVERFYSSGVYLVLQRQLTSASNRVPFAMFDMLLVVAIVGWLLPIGLDIGYRRGDWARMAWRNVVRTVVWAAAFYAAFLIVWGLNYRRVPLAHKLQFDSRRVSPDAAWSLATMSVDQLNALHARAHRLGWGERAALEAAFERTQRDLGGHQFAVPGRPKPTLLDPYFRLAGVDGMTAPYFLETLVARDLLPFERPIVVAHEWSHLAGFADEGEANFVGWLTCLRGSAADQYSGWLFLYEELTSAIGGRERGDLAARLAPGPRTDLRAIAARIRRQVSPVLSATGWRVYDRYLKANRVEAGAASYGGVVRLALGVRFGAGWTPLMAR